MGTRRVCVEAGPVFCGGESGDDITHFKSQENALQVCLEIRL